MKTKGLTIQEAIQSGLPFKRPHNSMYSVASDFKCFELDEVMAQDWELKVPEVTITREKLEQAFIKTYGVNSLVSEYFNRFCKELGL